MKKLTYCVLCLALCLAALAVPTPAAADCHEGCCADMQQRAEAHCASLGTWVTYFYCEEGYMGSCCAGTWDCYPPWQ